MLGTLRNDAAAMCLDNSETHCEPDTGAGTNRLCREIGLENSAANLARDARAGICNRRLNSRIDFVVTRNDRENPFAIVVRHCLLSVDNQVHEHLVQLIGIGKQLREVRGKILNDLHTAGL